MRELSLGGLLSSIALLLSDLCKAPPGQVVLSASANWRRDGAAAAAHFCCVSAVLSADVNWLVLVLSAGPSVPCIRGDMVPLSAPKAAGARVMGGAG